MNNISIYKMDLLVLTKTNNNLNKHSNISLVIMIIKNSKNPS